MVVAIVPLVYAGYLGCLQIDEEFLHLNLQNRGYQVGANLGRMFWNRVAGQHFLVLPQTVTTTRRGGSSSLVGLTNKLKGCQGGARCVERKHLSRGKWN